MSSLPALNASLNATAGVLLCAGLWFVKRRRLKAHERCMLAASVVSAAFLVSYVYYHFVVQPVLGPTRYNGTGFWKGAYLAMLASHVLLAVVNVPLVAMTLWRASRRNWEGHRRIARVTWPIWFYVSVTGVLVYFVLYRWNPASP